MNTLFVVLAMLFLWQKSGRVLCQTDYSQSDSVSDSESDWYDDDYYYSGEDDSPDDNDEEQTLSLIQQKFKNYDNSIRPSITVNWNFFIIFQQVISLNEDTQILTSSFNIIATWKDDRLTWDPERHNNWPLFRIQAKKLWLPDLVIDNSVNRNIFLKVDDSLKALVYHDGTITITYNVPFTQTSCPIDILKYPFDTQVCPIVISSWTLPRQNLTLDFDIESSDFVSNFKTNSVWNLRNVTYESQNVTDRVGHDKEIENYESVNFVMKLVLSRKPMYYIVNMVFPCLVLNFVTLVSFAMPNVSQFALCVTLILTFSMNQLSTNKSLPVQSEMIPPISIFFLISEMFALLAFTWFVIDFSLRSINYVPGFLIMAVKPLRCVRIPYWCNQKEEIETKQNKIEKLHASESQENLKEPIRLVLNAEQNQESVQATRAVSAKNKDLLNFFVNQETRILREERSRKAREEQQKTITNEVDKTLLFINRFLFVVFLIGIFTTNMAIWLSLSS